MIETDIQSNIRLALSNHGIVFRTNSGDFYQGERAYSKEFKQPVLINLRKVAGLPKGFSDLLFIGDGNVAFIECKTAKGRASPEQINFIERMQAMHHQAGVARSVEEALKIINI